MENLFSLRIPSDLGVHSEYQLLYKKLYARMLIIIGLPLTTFFVIYNLYHSRYFVCSIVFIMFLTLCFFLYDFIKKSELRRTDLFQEFIVRFFLIFFVIYMLFELGIEKSLSKTPWFLIFSVLIFFPTNIKEALVWVSCIAVIFFISFFIRTLAIPTTRYFI